MDAARFFLLKYEPLHAVMTDRLLADLSDAQLRARPPDQNSIAWLLRHVARCEDIGVNRFATDGPEVFDEGGWQKRLGVARRDAGTGMTSEEVSDLSARIDLSALREYWSAVGQRTVEVIRSYGSKGWDEVIDPARIRWIVRDSGDVGPNANVERLESTYGGMTRGWAFAHFVLTHSYGHFYEANVVRGMLGSPSSFP